jgi:hypothetical protein
MSLKTDVGSLGGPEVRMIAARTGQVATKAALTALAGSDRGDGDIRQVSADRSTWQYVSGSTLIDATATLVAVADDAAGAWLRCDKVCHLRTAIAFGTADAASMFLVPVGYTVEVIDPYWEITTLFNGGALSAIGLSSDLAPTSTKGDILGGASGDTNAGVLGATGKAIKGTAGAVTAHRFVLTSGKKLRYDRIASVFTSGAGFVNAWLRVLDA